MATGSLWAFAVALLPPLYTFATSVTVARFLGAAGLGRITFIGFVQSTLGVVLVMGLPLSIMRHVGEARGSGHSGRIRPLIRSLARPVVGLALLGSVSLAMVGLLGGEPRYAWVLAGIACAGGVLQAIPSAVLVGIQRWRDAYIVGLSSGAVALAAKVVVLVAGGGITWLFAIDAVIVTINLLGTSLIAHRATRRILPADEPVGDLPRRVWRFASIAAVGVFINFVVYRRTEVFFLERFSTDTQVALYSVPFSLVETLILLPKTVGTVIAPAVATLFGAGRHDRIASGFNRALRIVLPLSFFATAGAVALGPTFIRLLYGSEFDRSGTVLVILISTLPFVPLMAVSASVLLGIGKQWVPIGIGAVAALCNIGLDLWLIPSYDAIGAAVANTGAQIVGSLPLAFYASKCVGSTLAIGPLVRAGVGAALAGGVTAAVVTELPPVAAVPAGAATFILVALPAALVLRVVSSDDRAWLQAVGPVHLVRPIAQAARILGRTLSSPLDER